MDRARRTYELFPVRSIKTKSNLGLVNGIHRSHRVGKDTHQLHVMHKERQLRRLLRI